MNYNQIASGILIGFGVFALIYSLLGISKGSWANKLGHFAPHKPPLNPIPPEKRRTNEQKKHEKMR